MYYLGQWAGYGEINNTRPANVVGTWYKENYLNMPDFVIFEGEKNIEYRLAEVKKVFPDIVYETTVSPGMIDRILFWLNPVNENQNVYIYRNTQSRPHKIE